MHSHAFLYTYVSEEQILEQRERKLKEMAERTKAQKVYDPFGRDIPERDSSGNIIRRAQKPRGNQDEEDVGRGNHPSAFPFGSHNLAHKKVQNIKDKAFDDTDGYDPWGRPGGGAPIKDNAGNRLANRTGALEREVCTHVYVPVCVCIYIYICVCVCVCVVVCVCTRMYIRIYICTYVQYPSLLQNFTGVFFAVMHILTFVHTYIRRCIQT